MNPLRHRSARFATALAAAGALARFGAAGAAAGPAAPAAFECHYEGHPAGLEKALQDVECLLQELHDIFTRH